MRSRLCSLSRVITARLKMSVAMIWAGAAEFKGARNTKALHTYNHLIKEILECLSNQ